MSEASCVYAGRVTHHRFAPKDHRLAYSVFYMLFDLDELAALDGRLRWFSLGRFNFLSFHEADHLGGGREPLRARVAELVARAGVAEPLGAVRLLCMPRMFGHVFNPLSVYFCHDAAGRLACMVYEVNNTFGERHCYVIPLATPVSPDGAAIRQSCEKAFYVSPFLDMGLVYDFTISPPGEAVSIAVDARDGGRPMIATCFSGARRALTDRILLRLVATHPLLTLKVVAGIHWEALRIALKGVKLRARPPAPREAVTFVPPS